MLKKEAYQSSPNRFDYLLTPMGEDFYRVIVSLGVWGDRWLGDGTGRPIILKHTSCGNTLDPQLICSSCDEELAFEDIDRVAHLAS